MKENTNSQIGIITFHCAYNHGAVLQAYALKRYLTKYKNNQSYNIRLLDYRPPYIVDGYKAWQNINLRQTGLFSTIRNAISMAIHFLPRIMRNWKFRKFEQEYLQPSAYNPEDPNESLDAIICGSDQIWNPLITNGFDQAYFGRFGNKIQSHRKIAYAASFGLQTIPPEQKPVLETLLNQMDAISVREQSALTYIQKEFPDLSATRVMDPTFLLEAQEWSEIDCKTKIKNNFILVYRLDQDDNMLQNAIDYSKLLNITLIEVCYNAPLGYRLKYNHKIKTSLGPTELLYYLKNADYIFTNSFHGTAFAIIFQKQFNAFIPNHVGGRIHDLLKMLSLESRIVTHNKNNTIGKFIDFKQTEPLLKNAIQSSKHFLDNSL